MVEVALVLRFDPNTIEHLGIRMYSRIPTAIAELIANSYDANAKKVVISLYGGENKKIVVKDDGDGMTFEEINDKFLVIGRNKREEEGIYSTKEKGRKKRITTGKKGLGKLALFGVGDTIRIETIKDNQRVVFEMDWAELKKTRGEYKPKIIQKEKCLEASKTTITLSNLKRESELDEEALAISLSKLFNFFDKDFKVFVEKNGKIINIDNDLKYSQIEEEFVFLFPEYSGKISLDYKYKKEIKGKILTTEKPLRPGLRGITLFANGRLVNVPEFFGSSESSYFYSYVVGLLEIDFVDNWKEDVISTNRQTLNWDLDETKELRDFLRRMLSELHQDWREKRNEKKRKVIKEKTKVDVEEWYRKLPDILVTEMEPLVNTIVEDSELSDDKQIGVLKKLHSMIPEYPYYHWRNLYSEIRAASKEDYEKGDYYRAFLEAAKRYINAVKEKSNSTNRSAESMMGEVFGKDQRKLSVTKNYKKPDGSDFNASTKENIEEGQKHLSMGVVSGGRNPVSHEEKKDLKESGLFTEKDCLDCLSVLSHLFKRLEESEVETTP